MSVEYRCDRCGEMVDVYVKVSAERFDRGDPSLVRMPMGGWELCPGCFAALDAWVREGES